MLMNPEVDLQVVSGPIDEPAVVRNGLELILPHNATSLVRDLPACLRHPDIRRPE